MESGTLVRRSSASATSLPTQAGPRVVYVEIGVPALRLADPNHAEILQLPVAVLPSIRGEVIAFVIAAAVPGDAETLLWQIRRHPDYYCTPAYLAVDANEAAHALADGVVSDLPSAMRAAEAINARLDELPDLPGAVTTQDFRMCAFLFSRPNWELKPIRTLSDPRLWAYPLADAMVDADQAPLAWLISLHSRGYLDDTELVDRVRECSRCDSAQLSFVDVCPDCRSVNIQDSQFLHCFACGHIAPEPNFIRRTGLQCPQCKQRLRHIGVDYDRPMEEYVCQTCTSSFVEGRVVARCLGCGYDNDPGQLNSRRILNFAATGKAHLAARQGQLEELPALMDSSRFAAPAYLMQMLEWMLSLTKRHENEHFSVVTIVIEDHAEAIAQLGDRNAGQRVDGFFGRLAELSRDTDIISRISRLSAWVLLAKSDSEAREQYIAQVAKIAGQTAIDGTEQIQIRCLGLSVPEDFPADITQQALLKILQED